MLMNTVCSKTVLRYSPSGVALTEENRMNSTAREKKKKRKAILQVCHSKEYIQLALINTSY